MANYANYRRGTFDLTVDSNFRPFSFQEMLAPLAIYDKAYREMEDDFLKQQKEVDTLKYLADTLPEKSEAREIYDNYVNDLQDALSDFGNSKLNPITANKLLNLKRRSGDLIKLKQIATIRDNQIKAQDAALAKDPTLILSRDARDTSFDEYMNNPDIGYKSYSGALIASQVADATSQLAKELTDLVQNRPTPALTSLEQQYGLKATDIAFALRHPESEDANKLLKLILDNVIEATGIREWGDPYALEKALDWGRTSFWKAIGQGKASGYNMPRATVTRTKQATENPIDKLIPPPPEFNGSNTSKNTTTTKNIRQGSPIKINAFGGTMSPTSNLFGGGGYTASTLFKKQLSVLSKDQVDDFIANVVYKLNPDDPWPSAKEQERLLKEYDDKLQENFAKDQYYALREYWDTQIPLNGLTPEPIYTQADKQIATKEAEQLDYFIKNLQKTKNGHYVLNKEAQKKYAQPLLPGYVKGILRTQAITSGMVPKLGALPNVALNNVFSTIDTEKNSFARFVDKYHLQPLAKGEAGPNQDKVVEQLYNRYNNTFDAFEQGKFSQDIDDTLYKSIASNLSSKLTNDNTLPHYEIVRDDKTKKPAFKKIFKEIKIKNGEPLEINSARAYTSPLGNYLSVDVNGTRLNIPFSALNPDADRYASADMKEALGYIRNHKKGEVINVPGVGLIPSDIAARKAAKSALKSLVSAFTRMKSDPEKTN